MSPCIVKLSTCLSLWPHYRCGWVTKAILATNLKIKRGIIAVGISYLVPIPLFFSLKNVVWDSRSLSKLVVADMWEVPTKYIKMQLRAKTIRKYWLDLLGWATTLNKTIL